jgi:hypothetical protein
VGPILQLKLHKNGHFIEAKVIPTKQLGEGIPVYDNDQRALLELIELSKEDFAESPLKFDAINGIIKEKIDSNSAQKIQHKPK